MPSTTSVPTTRPVLCVKVRRACRGYPVAHHPTRRDDMSAAVTTCRHHLPGRAMEPTPHSLSPAAQGVISYLMAGGPRAGASVGGTKNALCRSSISTPQEAQACRPACRVCEPLPGARTAILEPQTQEPIDNLH